MKREVARKVGLGRRPRRKRGFWGAALAVLSIFCLPAPDAGAQSISWARYSKPCKKAAHQASIVARAGNYGVFYFGSAPITGCPRKRVAGCTEEPPIYPPPGPSPMDGSLGCTSGCGKKFSDMNHPWGLILDWKNWHGKSVDALFRSSTDPAIESMLLPLEDHFPQYKKTITDADVVYHLAELAEAVDRGGIPRPLVLNMSFGRLHESHDALNGKCDQKTCGKGSLGCQLARLLKYLSRSTVDEPGTVVIASRGNDMLELGPGEFEEVISVGMTDLTELADDGTVVQAWESPPKFDALMPGGGFCLKLDDDGDPPDSIESALPTGSSYSAALFSGMIAEQLWLNPQTVRAHLDNGPLWTPRNKCFDDGCPFLLSHSGTDFPILSGNGNARIMEFVTGNLSTCGPSDTMEDLSADLIASGVGPYIYPTLPELTVSTHRQTPDTATCVPCGGCCQSFPFSAPADQKANPGGASRKPAQGSGPGRVPTTISLTIDMHSSWYIYPTELKIEQLYLRVGQELRRVDLNSTALLPIANGEVDKLTLTGTFYTLDMNAQPSLIFVISRVANPDEWFWKSTPVYLEPAP